MATSLQEVLKKLQFDSSQQEQAAINFKSLGEMREHLTAQFPDIKPTAKEYYAGMLQAFKAAANRLHKHHSETEKQERIKTAREMWSYERQKEQALSTGWEISQKQQWAKPFVIDEHNQDVFHLLCLYFTNDPEFEKHGQDGVNYSLNKGIWLQSEIRGSGKSVLLQCFQINKRQCFGYVHTAQLGNIFVRSGFPGVDQYTTTTWQPSSAFNFYQEEAGFMYDEMFSEGIYNGWGTQLFPSRHIINSLYDFSTNKKGQLWKFHITSNFDGNDIEEVAGKNIRSRMPDMFNLIKLGGINRRV